MKSQSLRILLAIYIIKASCIADTKGVDKSIDLAFKGHVVYYCDALIGVWKFYKKNGKVKFEKYQPSH